MAKIKGIKTKTGDNTSAVAKTTADGGAPAQVSSGVITMLAQATVPSGWFLCDGTAYSQTTYASLYAVIGSAYNTHPTLGAPAAGNFRVPDLRDVFPLAMNPSGATGTTALGTYSTTGWNHTHTVPAHSHTLANHTHTLGNHTHSVPAHSHTLNSHTHSVPSHAHAIYGHIHYFAGHQHSGTVNVTASHYHQMGVTSDSATGSSDNRVSNTATGTMTSNSTGAFTLGIGGTIGNANNADSGHNTDWYSYAETQNVTATSGTTGTPSANSGTSAVFNSGTPSAASGVPSSNTTSSDGAAATGSANPPYFGVHFIIKA